MLCVWLLARSARSCHIPARETQEGGEGERTEARSQRQWKSEHPAFCPSTQLYTQGKHLYIQTCQSLRFPWTRMGRSLGVSDPLVGLGWGSVKRDVDLHACIDLLTTPNSSHELTHTISLSFCPHFPPSMSVSGYTACAPSPVVTVWILTSLSPPFPLRPRILPLYPVSLPPTWH